MNDDASMTAGASLPKSSNTMRATVRLRQSLPSLRLAIAGSAIWGLAMGASALVTLLLGRWETPDLVRIVVLMFALGGAFAFPFGWTLARLLSQGRRPETAFAAAFVSLAVATISLTALLYALQYRSYYAEWHAAPFTITWAFQFVFTGLVALYQFAVLGVRLYFPVGFVVLFAAALWFAARSR